MPVPVIAALIGLAGAGITAGVSIHNTDSQESQAKQEEAAQRKLQQEQLQQTAQQNLLSSEQSSRAALPNAQAQTGGSLTGDALSSLIASLSGQPGTVQEISKYLGGETGGFAPSNITG